jgi:hypothetical protein
MQRSVSLHSVGGKVDSKHDLISETVPSLLATSEWLMWSVDWGEVSLQFLRVRIIIVGRHYLIKLTLQDTHFNTAKYAIEVRSGSWNWQCRNIQIAYMTTLTLRAYTKSIWPCFCQQVSAYRLYVLPADTFNSIPDKLYYNSVRHTVDLHTHATIISCSLLA